MTTKNLRKELGIVLILIIPIIFLFIIWKSIPEIIPTHFGIDGKADHTGPKISLFFMTLVVSFIGFGVGLMIKYAPKLDPKKAGAVSPERLHKIRSLLSVFLSAVGCVMVYTCAHNDIHLITLIPVAMGILFAGLGNYMNNIKQNSIIGFRTKKTLENQEIWRKTHQFTSRLWFFSGLIMIPVFLLLPYEVMPFALIGFLIALIIIPLVYSNRIYSQITKSL